MSDIAGFALRRNGSCLSTEEECGIVTFPFHACCPGGTFCPKPQYNAICCPSDADCSELLEENCADSKADLYTADPSDIPNERFCCERGKYAFGMKDEEEPGVGCADDVSDLQFSMRQLQAISSASGTPTPTPSSISSDFVTASGAIVGGVVGGVAGVAILIALVWFVFRRRNKHRKDQLQSMPPPTNHTQQHFPQSDSERLGPPSELDAKNGHQVSELYAGPATHQ
ncbi:hypothetical protein N7445_009647 [Penicillium cf. griseofulvum]|nr:hypothetical protein N7445_009647 [Penicillium cf. griseofulvum]